MNNNWLDNVAVLHEGEGELEKFRQLAAKLHVPTFQSTESNYSENIQLYLTWRSDCLILLDAAAINKPGLTVEIDHRQGEQRSWPMAKTGALAQALGRKTQTIVDATAGWGQDALAMFRMGYQVQCIERSPIMSALLADGFRRLGEQDWMQRLQVQPPGLLAGNAIELLPKLPQAPDCIYLDPMFPPKRKKSALAKKSIVLLRGLVGDDLDKDALFSAALKAAGKRVVVKSPDYAEPLGDKPAESFQGKLLRYDVYFTHNRGQ
jgi:16S rRNA (guanine1516-N2)-methyltransferase